MVVAVNQTNRKDVRKPAPSDFAQGLGLAIEHRSLNSLIPYVRPHSEAQVATIAGAWVRGSSPADENEAEAIALLFWVTETHGDGA